MIEQAIEPVDTCGCGDVGYLTTRRVPMDLVHGVGRIDNVPVYHCGSSSCPEYSLPPIVSRRLEEIAEEMETTQTEETVYTWSPSPEQAPDSQQRNHEEVHLQAFTLQFGTRQYEDAKVVLIVPGQEIFFRSTLEASEYYLLRYEAAQRTEGTWFSFNKFYYEEPELTYEDFLKWSEDGHLKEIGQITQEEVEDTLTDEFGDWS